MFRWACWRVVQAFRVVELTGSLPFIPGQPFPRNPYFQAVPPVSDAMRERMFTKFSEDPRKWSPRILAEEYGLSQLRVQAILKLKTLEKKFAAQVRVELFGFCSTTWRVNSCGCSFSRDRCSKLN
jgi:hypothetical protein